jgi:hypothetical protein
MKSEDRATAGTRRRSRETGRTVSNNTVETERQNHGAQSRTKQPVTKECEQAENNAKSSATYKEHSQLRAEWNLDGGLKSESPRCTK